MRQIIDYEFNFKERIGDVLDLLCDEKSTVKYNVVSILGSQSTGKSTLLNSLFGTNFKVMDKVSVGYCQTTKGLWLSVGDGEYKSPLLVWDVEGTDSLERGEDRITFENRASLFSLAISDCMIINLPLLNLTTYTSSNFGLLKTIINSWFSLRLDENEQSESKTTLIFAIRDITISDNDEMLIRKINQILDLLWNQVLDVQNSQLNNINDEKKSIATRFKSLYDIFDVKVYGIPSFPNDKDNFIDIVGKMKRELINFVLPRKYSRNVPLDSYETYCKAIWNCIVNCEELNIPSQIKMISKFRCEKIKDDVLFRMKPKIRDLRRKMEKRELEYIDFTNDTYDILSQSTNDYFDIAGKYDSEVSLKTSVTLLVLFLIEFKDAVNIRMSTERQNLRECKNILEYYNKSNINKNGNVGNSDDINEHIFDSQIWSERELDRFDKISLKWVTECPNNISKYKLVDQIKSKCIPEILNKVEEISRDDENVGNNELLFNYNTNDQRKLFIETLEIQSKKIKERLIQEFFEALIRDIIKDASNIFNAYAFTNPKLTINDFWIQAGESIINIHDSLLHKYKTKWLNLLKSSSSIDEYSCTDLEVEIAIQIFVRLISFIQQQSKYFHIQIIERFKKEFEIDEQDIPRQWIGEDPNKMKELFINSKNNALSIIEVFKPKGRIFKVFGTKFEDLYSKIVEHPEVELISSKCSLGDNDTIFIIPENTIQEVEAKSIQEITSIYSKAQLLQSTGKQPQNIPWWMYLLLLFFGFDELMYVLTSPFILTLLLIIGTLLYSYLTGNMSLFCNFSQKIVIFSSKFLYYLTGILHNSLDPGNNKFNSD